MDRQPVITREMAEAIAVRLFAEGYDSPYSTTKDWRKDEKGHYVTAADAVDLSAFGTLPEFWTCDVADVIGEWESQAWDIKLARSIDALDTTAGIREYLLQAYEARERGFRDVRTVDMRSYCKSARERGYKPVAACAARLQMGSAVSYSYRQEAYADESTTLIPVTADGALDVAACNRNLSAFCQAIKTHTGWAGSGCSYSASLCTDYATPFVIFHCRASIAD